MWLVHSLCERWRRPTRVVKGRTWSWARAAGGNYILFSILMLALAPGQRTDDSRVKKNTGESIRKLWQQLRRGWQWLWLWFQRGLQAGIRMILGAGKECERLRHPSPAIMQIVSKPAQSKDSSNDSVSYCCKNLSYKEILPAFLKPQYLGIGGSPGVF